FLYLDRSYFFFQAEDGIRDPLVTGVQTCAIPISRNPGVRELPGREPRSLKHRPRLVHEHVHPPAGLVSEIDRRQRRPDSARRQEIGRASCRARVESSAGEGAITINGGTRRQETDR